VLNSTRLKAFAVLDGIFVFLMILIFYLQLKSMINFSTYEGYLIIIVVVYLALGFTIRYYFNKKGIPKSVLG
jgi:hypothetical protein